MLEDNAFPQTRQTGKNTHSPTFALEEHDQLVRRLEAGIQHRDEMMAKERERHRVEMASLSKRLLDADEREAAMQKELLSAKKELMALDAAHRRIAEMTRTNDAAAHKLASLSDAASLDQEKHTVVSNMLEAERRTGASLRAELEAVRAQMARSTVRAADSDAALKQLESMRATEVGKLEAQLRIARDQVLYRTIQRFLQRDLSCCLDQWTEWAVKQQKVQITLGLARRKLHHCWLGSSFRTWLGQTQISKRIGVILARAKEIDGARLNHAWSTWAVLAHQAMRRLLRHKRSTLKVDLGAVTQELQELQASCHAQQVSLSESLDLIRTLELIHREEHGRMETEIAALKDRLRAKRESCEKLRRVNTHIIRQFEAAEADFAAAEQRRKESASSSVVGRVFESVFGSEPPALSASKAQMRHHPDELPPSIWLSRHRDGASPRKPSSPGEISDGDAFGRWGSRSPSALTAPVAPSQRKHRMHKVGTIKPPRHRFASPAQHDARH